MKIIILVVTFFYGCCSAFSQVDSLFLKNYDQKTIENKNLKNDLRIEKQNFSDLSNAYEKDTVALQKQIKDLQNKLESEEKKVINLNKNKVKAERDTLLHRVDSLNELLFHKVDSFNTIISTLNRILSEKDTQMVIQKEAGIQKASEEKEKGKAEVLARIVNSYKDQPFDDLINSLTKESVARDIQLIGNNQEVNVVLNDLQTYFNAQELLSEKFDAIEIEKAQTKLSQINHRSKLLDALKEDVDFYQDFNTALKKVISKLVDLDNNKSTGGDSEIQKMKFNDIVIELTNYMYNFYDYGNYPYLSDIMLEIIKRKQLNADADIKDLLDRF